jgi:hypothetical protein
MPSSLIPSREVSAATDSFTESAASSWFPSRVLAERDASTRRAEPMPTPGRSTRAQGRARRRRDYPYGPGACSIAHAAVRSDTELNHGGLLVEELLCRVHPIDRVPPASAEPIFQSAGEQPITRWYRRYFGVGPRQVRTLSLGHGTRTEQSGTSTVPVDRYHQTIGWSSRPPEIVFAYGARTRTEPGTYQSRVGRHRVAAAG